MTDFGVGAWISGEAERMNTETVGIRLTGMLDHVLDHPDYKSHLLNDCKPCQEIADYLAIRTPRPQIRTDIPTRPSGW